MARYQASCSQRARGVPDETANSRPPLRLSQNEFRSGSVGRNLSEEAQREVEVGLVTNPVRLGRFTQLLTGRW